MKTIRKTLSVIVVTAFTLITISAVSSQERELKPYPNQLGDPRSPEHPYTCWDYVVSPGCQGIAEKLPYHTFNLGYHLGVIRALASWDLPAQNLIGELSQMENTIMQWEQDPTGSCRLASNTSERIAAIINTLKSTNSSRSVEYAIFQFVEDIRRYVGEKCPCFKEPTARGQWYNVQTPPYGGGRVCLTEQQAASLRARGARVRSTGIPCTSFQK